MKKILRAALFVLAFSFILISAAQAQSPQQTLNQYVADLQKSPNDYALREKIIKYVQTMKPKPAVPDEAQKYMDRGLAAIEGGKGEEDFRAASAEFSKAVNLAPWLGDAYRNLAIAQDKSGQYDAALKNLRLYLLTSPSPADEAWAKSLINKVEYRKEKAAQESSPQANTSTGGFSTPLVSRSQSSPAAAAMAQGEKNTRQRHLKNLFNDYIRFEKRSLFFQL